MRIHLIALVPLAVLAHARAARAQLVVEPDRPVGPPLAYPVVEPHLSTAPSDPRRLVVGAMVPLSADDGSMDCMALASTDGGRSWTVTRLGLSGPTGCGDAWTAATGDGSALLSYGADSLTVVRRSADDGRTWSAPSLAVPGWFDHAMLAARGETVYLVGSARRRDPGRRPRPAVYVARSTDGGRTFVERCRLVLTNVEQEAITPLVLADGALVVGTIDHGDASGRRLERRRAWLVVSGDSGATFTEPLLIAESCSRTRNTAWPSLAASPRRDAVPERLFFTCEANGNHGVLFARSDDRGERWTPVRRIDGGADSAWAKTPTMAVSASGVLAVTWVDARDDATGRCWHLYGTASRDGGATFLPAQRLSSAASCPTAAASGAGVVDRFPSGGEYHGLAAVGASEFVAVWPDARDGIFRLRSVRFRVPER